ncbi:MAG: hypothetical protein GAS50_10590 [Desulfobacterales bacterium]|nr:hypothetical protein [Desulfobacterales bacterium]
MDTILTRQFRPLVYYFHIPGIAEDPVALCARQFPDNTEALQMIEAIVVSHYLSQNVAILFGQLVV